MSTKKTRIVSVPYNSTIHSEDDVPSPKHDQGKVRLDLLPTSALNEIGRVLTYGANKYKPEGWKTISEPVPRYTSALLRHMFAWMSGQTHDEESGLHHLAHVGCNALFLIEHVMILQVQK